MSRRLDEVTDQEVREALKNSHNRAIIKQVAKRYSSVLSYDDGYACGLVALWKTLAKHEANRGQKFTTSLYRFARWECLRTITRSKANKWKVSQEITEDILGKHKTSKTYSQDAVGYVFECMQLLKEEDRDLVLSYYIEGRTIEEIAGSLSIAKESARQKLISAFDRLKELATDPDLGLNRDNFLSESIYY